MSDRPFDAALADGRITLTGSRDVIHRFRRWFLLNVFAEVERPA